MRSSAMVRRNLLGLTLMVVCSVVLSACGSGSSNGGAAVLRLQSVPIRIVFRTGIAAVEIAIEEIAGTKIDVEGLLAQIFKSAKPENGLAPKDTAVLMVVNKTTNNVVYWQLTNNVKMIRLKHNDPGAIELKIINEKPLRIELWMNGDIKTLEVIAEMQGT